MTPPHSPSVENHGFPPSAEAELLMPCLRPPPQPKRDPQECHVPCACPQRVDVKGPLLARRGQPEYTPPWVWFQRGRCTWSTAGKRRRLAHLWLRQASPGPAAAAQEAAKCRWGPVGDK